jgi:hypothetical protein
LMFTLFLFAVISINGCSPEATSGNVVKDSVCNAPYLEFKSGECCLDTNSNSICDSDETIVEEEVTEEVAEAKTEEAKTEETTTEAAPETKEVEITIQDSCTDTTYFECKSSYVSKDEVFLKLKTRRDGYTHLKKISSLGCEQEFADKSKAGDGYVINSEFVVSIPCLKNSPGDEIDDADIVLDYIFYPITGIDPNTGKWDSEIERALQRSTGKISGTVRNEPKKI